MKVMPSSFFQTYQFILHILAELQVQGAQRLIQQENPWFIDDGSCDGDTLLLAAAQGCYLTVFITVQVYQFQGVGKFYL